MLPEEDPLECGVTVSLQSTTKETAAAKPLLAETVRSIPRSGIRDFFDLVSTTPGVISLGVGEPGFVTPWPIRESAIGALHRGSVGYTEPRGDRRLREAIARYVENTFSIPYDPDREILVTVGVSEGLDLAIRSVVNPGDEVLYHEPCYVSNRPLILLAHGAAVAVQTLPQEGFRLNRRLLEEKVTDRTRVLVLNFPNNPTGAVLDRHHLEEIAAFARDRELVVISDEIYAELVYEGEPFSMASLPGMKERTIFLHGVSKAWAMTGFRLGFACAPPDLIEAMLRIHRNSVWCAPLFSQEAARTALEEGHAEVEKMRAEYRRQRDFICRRFQEMGLPCVRPQGAFYAFPSIKESGLSSHEFAVRLVREGNVAAVPGTAFGAGGEGFLRCSFATPLSELEEAMNRLDRFLATLHSERKAARR